jgi:hypothetical protein
MVASCAAGQGTSVALWGGEPLPRGEAVAVSLDGVAFLDAARSADAASGGPTLVGWDRVRAVDGELGLASEAYMPIARAAWRGRIRVQRDDLVSAEPILERLVVRYRGRVGPTAAVVSEGLLRCRLRRGALTSSVTAWLSLLAATEGDTAPVIEGLGPVVDARTGLVPGLPPVWRWSSAVAEFAQQGPVLPGSSGHVAALGELYTEGARAAGGSVVSGEVLERASARRDHEGVRLAWAVVASGAEDDGVVREAVGELREILVEAELDASRAWVVAWCRLAIGRSMVRSSDPVEQRLGVVELLRVPAEIGDEAAFVAGLALADAADAVARLGNAAGAAALERELVSRYAGHPALDVTESGAAVLGRGRP